MLTAVGQRELTTRRTEQTPTIRSPSGTPTRKVTIKKKNLETTHRRDVTSVRDRVRARVCERVFSVQFYEGLGHRRSRSRRRSWQKPDRRRRRQLTRFTIKPRATGYDLGEVTRT